MYTIAILYTGSSNDLTRLVILFSEGLTMSRIHSIIFALSGLLCAGIVCLHTSATAKPERINQTGAAPYEGRLVVYLIEPNSRWFMYSGDKYHNGFLDFALDTAISVNYMDSLQFSVEWDAVDAGFYIISDTNIMAIAAIFNDEIHISYSAPPDTFPFDAYYVDALAGATVDSQWNNTFNDSFTHRVLAEVATTTYCYACPLNSEMLYDLFQSHDYPFFYIEMIADKVDTAMSWLDLRNCKYASTIYYDGGDNVTVSSEINESFYRDPIENSGAREVYYLGLTVDVEWLGNMIIRINVTVDNTLFENMCPEAPPPPGGPWLGLTDQEYTYSACAADPDNDEIYYCFQWSPENISEWFGPFQSDDACTIGHTWSAPGTYEVQVKARDSWKFESDWSLPLTVVIHDYVAGDANGDKNINILDATFIINYLYKGGAAPIPPEAANANCDGATNILDVTFLINYLYKLGPAPCYPG